MCDGIIRLFCLKYSLTASITHTISTHAVTWKSILSAAEDVPNLFLVWTLRTTSTAALIYNEWTSRNLLLELLGAFCAQKRSLKSSPTYLVIYSKTIRQLFSQQNNNLPVFGSMSNWVDLQANISKSQFLWNSFLLTLFCVAVIWILMLPAVYILTCHHKLDN